MNEYNKMFYSENMKGSMLSAERIIPYVMDMLSPIHIASVVDFGCGIGGWLSQFQKINPSINILGLDSGNPEESQLQLPVGNYKKADLSKEINLNKKYDLCISLEVAEHLEPKYAEVGVGNICRHSDIILFSAALTGQGGTNHVNERLLSYWAKKFRKRGYIMYDIIRPYFWNDRNIEVWYRQNMVLFIEKGVDIRECHFKKETYKAITDIAHPELLYSNRKAQADKLINRDFIYFRSRRMYYALKKIKHLFGVWGRRSL